MSKKPPTMPAVMSALASERPIFHSEADFQLALAWKLQQVDESARIRLEYRPMANEALYLDIWAHTPDWTLAIELKYRTRSLQAEVGGERFTLLSHGAYDQGRYDYIADVVRIERTVQKRGGSGCAILLTNDSNYWQVSPSATTADWAFRLHQGCVLSGTLAWSPRAGPSTRNGREAAPALSGAYQLDWCDYAVVDAKRPHGQFRYLLVPIAATGAIHTSESAP